MRGLFGNLALKMLVKRGTGFGELNGITKLLRYDVPINE
jgi:hypothetical protein